VCRQLRHWLDLGVSIPVAINCSAKEMMHGDPAAVIAAEAAAAGISPSLIEVEITESLLANDSVVQNVDRSPADAAVASAILSLASSLNLGVVAEGIERPEQLEWLRQRGCHEGQGFLLSKPLSPWEFTRRHVSPDVLQAQSEAG
jgi:diguanylate cyclase